MRSGDILPVELAAAANPVKKRRTPRLCFCVEEVAPRIDSAPLQNRSGSLCRCQAFTDSLVSVGLHHLFEVDHQEAVGSGFDEEMTGGDLGHRGLQ